MTRGHRKPNPEVNHAFIPAFEKIRVLEEAVVLQLTNGRVTANEALEWLYDAEALTALRRGFPYTRVVDQAPTTGETIPSVNNEPTMLFLRTQDLKMLAPDSGEYVRAAEIGPVWATILDIYAIHNDFNKVRRVIGWLHEHATVGAAVALCPWLPGLMPDGHASQTMRGAKYKEPTASLADIVPVMRECSSILAAAAFAPIATCCPMIKVQFGDNLVGRPHMGVPMLPLCIGA